MEAVYERCCGVDVHKKIITYESYKTSAGSPQHLLQPELLYITFCRVAGAFVRPFLVACAIIFMTMTGGVAFSVIASRLRRGNLLQERAILSHFFP